MRGRYCFKGLGAVIGGGLLSSLDLFVRYEEMDLRAVDARDHMDVLTRCYDSIPFD